MPSNWLYIDTNFPSFTQKESENDKIETMQDYLFMLVEQLRYTLHNLDLSNMNRAAADGIAKMITDPIYAEIQDAESNITQLGVTAQGLAARMSNAEGNITQLTATANGLSASVSSLNGSVTNLTADVNGLRTTVSGKINSSQAQTLIDQSLQSITLAATSDDSGTVFQIKKDGAVLASTGTFDICVDAVNIYGTLTAQKIRGDTVSILDSDGNECGLFQTTFASSSDYKLDISSSAMELFAEDGSVFIGSVWVRREGYGASIEVDGNSAEVQIKGNVIPDSDDKYDLGSPNFVWSNVYCGTNELNGSDRNIKNSIEALPEKYVKMLDMVEPKRYKLNNGTSGRYHVGFIAQEVEDAMNACGIDSQEFGGWAKAKDADGNDTYFLRYGEFIAILLAKLREQDRRIERLEGTV